MGHLETFYERNFIFGHLPRFEGGYKGSKLAILGNNPPFLTFYTPQKTQNGQNRGQIVPNRAEKFVGGPRVISKGPTKFSDRSVGV